jgi:hypothetical protein
VDSWCSPKIKRPRLTSEVDTLFGLCKCISDASTATVSEPALAHGLCRQSYQLYSVQGQRSVPTCRNIGFFCLVSLSLSSILIGALSGFDEHPSAQQGRNVPGNVILFKHRLKNNAVFMVLVRRAMGVRSTEGKYSTVCEVATQALYISRTL